MLTFTRMKDCDVTWLYGPLQTRPDELSERSSSLISSSGTSKFNSFMLKDAGPRMPEQQSREAERKLGQSCIGQAVSDYKASLSAGSEKHVRFSEQVEQCFALEITGDENKEDGWYATH